MEYLWAEEQENELEDTEKLQRTRSLRGLLLSCTGRAVTARDYQLYVCLSTRYESLVQFTYGYFLDTITL